MSYVTSSTSDGVATLVLDDPEKRNAINLHMNEEIVALLEGWEADESIAALIVTGAPPAFCAGADLDELLHSGERGELHAIYRGFLRVAHSPLATIAAVNGAAVGAGMNMALACDVIVAAESARFDSRFPQIGLHPGGGHTWRLREKTNDQVVRAMLLFGQVLGGQRAAEVGLAFTCVPDDELLAAATAMAAKAARIPPTVRRSITGTIEAARQISDSIAAIEREVGPQVQSMQTPEFQELVTDLQQGISSR